LLNTYLDLSSGDVGIAPGGSCRPLQLQNNMKIDLFNQRFLQGLIQFYQISPQKEHLYKLYNTMLIMPGGYRGIKSRKASTGGAGRKSAEFVVYY
jgi:hypothetical protein